MLFSGNKKHIYRICDINIISIIWHGSPIIPLLPWTRNVPQGNLSSSRLRNSGPLSILRWRSRQCKHLEIHSLWQSGRRPSLAPFPHNVVFHFGSGVWKIFYSVSEDLFSWIFFNRNRKDIVMAKEVMKYCYGQRSFHIKGFSRVKGVFFAVITVSVNNADIFR